MNLVLPNLPASLKLRLPRGLSADAAALAEALAQRQPQPIPQDLPVVVPNVSRRSFIRSALAAAALAAGVSRIARADGLPPTRSDIEGPFYRADPPFRNVLYDEADIPYPLFVWGQVLDTDKNPLPGAVVDLWQADTVGEYDNDSPEYRGRGVQLTDDDALWWTYTTWPGYYPGRPWHLHAKVSQKGYRFLTTQLYFRDDPRPHPAELELDWFEWKEWPGVYLAYFNIVLARA
jgi:hypothetical protein